LKKLWLRSFVSSLLRNMLRLLLLFFPFVFVNAQVCDKTLNDPITELNYEGCNNAGRCEGNRRTRCVCCNPEDSANWCFGSTTYPHPYIFSGTTCTTVSFIYAVTFGWRFQYEAGKAEITCADMLTDPPGNGGVGFATDPPINNQVQGALEYPVDQSGASYTGIIYAAACQTCRPGNPCNFAGLGTVTENAITAGFASEYNTFYDPTCASFQIDQPRDCAANTDLGVTAEQAFIAARGDTSSQNMLLTRSLNAVLTGSHYQCGDQLSGICLSWTETEATVYVQNDLSSQRENFIITTDAPTPTPTEHPTDPTPQPTATPTETPTAPDVCFKYTNRVMDHKFIGSADNCRAGLRDEWPGGKTCASPYVICLPDANTPANPDPTAVPNFGQTLPATDYSIQECAEECAYDQRCLGFELRPDAGSNRGECMLIDDIPVEMDNQGSWPSGTQSHIHSGLAVKGADQTGHCCEGSELAFNVAQTADQCTDACYENMDCNAMSYASAIAGGACALCSECTLNSNALYTSNEITGRLMLGSPANFDTIGRPALCYAKMDYCNPFFEAADLDQEMLDCYCPNNRKGTYTKKVKRTIANTRFCGSDAAVDDRIKKAQANRMFHLCENWCLFETHNPMTESWYWDPWHTCWREQYAGYGTHRSYCNRVIRDPMTIEQQFINNRSDNFCRKDPNTGEIIVEITEEPTGQPSTFASTWSLAAEEESCDDACSSQGKQCDELTTNSLTTGNEGDIDTAVGQVGETCSSHTAGQEGWALPAIATADNSCVSRNPSTEYTGCNWATGVGYRRLCACY